MQMQPASNSSGSSTSTSSPQQLSPYYATTNLLAYSCLVCSGPSNGICHFGVQCCRACASFFHRSVKEKRQYICRGDQNCRISNDEGLRNSCRACRLNKCLLVGMTGEKKRERKVNNAAAGSNSEPQPHQQSQQHHHQRSYSPPTDERFFAAAAEPFLDPETIKITNKFADSLHQYNNAFQAVSVVEGISTELPNGGDCHIKGRLISYDEFVRLQRASLMLVYSMLCEYMPAIRQLPIQSRENLLKTFQKQFMVLEICYLSERAGIHPDASHSMVVPGGLVDLDHLDKHFFWDIQGSEEKQRVRTSIVSSHFDFLRKYYSPLGISQLEFAALTVILFFKTLEKTVPSALPTEQSSWQRETLYAELYTIILGTAQQQQQNASPVRAAVRFAKLLDVLQQLAFHACAVDEIYVMGKIFTDLPDTWDKITSSLNEMSISDHGSQNTGTGTSLTSNAIGFNFNTNAAMMSD